VRKPGLRGDFWPTEFEEQLVRAALLPPPQGTTAWKQVRDRLDIDSLAGEPLRLLPLVYVRLKAAGRDDPVMPRLKGLYRRAWYHNQLQLARLGEILRLFGTAGIDTLVLKGASLIARYYDDPGVRPMADVDVLVPVKDAPTAMRILEAGGWQRPPFDEAELIRRIHGISYRDGRGHVCDLHWQLGMNLVIPGHRAESADAFWEGSDEIQIAGTRTRALNPADQLLHVIIHGAGSYSGTTLQWIADSLTILRGTEGRFDWDRLVAESSRRRTFRQVRDALVYLARALGAPVPSEAIERLEAVPAAQRDVFIHWATARHRSRFLGTLLHSFGRYMQLQPHGVFRSVARLPRFLKQHWGLQHLWQIPIQVLQRTGRKARERHLSRGRPSVSEERRAPTTLSRTQY
jgi:hypothetical protein